MSGRNRHWYAQLAAASLASIDEFRAFALRTRGFRFSSDYAARIAMMKLRIALPEVAAKEKQAAREWLTAHGCSHSIFRLGPGS